MERRQENIHETDRRSSFDGTVKHTETGEVLNVLKAPYGLCEGLSLSGIYEHYKSTPDNPKLYRVEGLFTNLETGECIVVYDPLYETEDAVPARPLRIFTENVTVEGQEMPRFRFVADEHEA